MANKTGSLEYLNEDDVTLYSVTYTGAAEDPPVVIPYTNQSIDLGTAAVAAADDVTAEKAVFLRSSTAGQLNNVKMFISSPFAGVKFVADTEAVLTSALKAAGTPAGYVTAAGGYFTTANAIPVVGTDTHRIRFQGQVNKAEWGTLPYDPDSDIMKYGANMYLLWESDDYVNKFDTMHGRSPSDPLVESTNCELFVIETHNGVETAVSLGDLDDGGVTFERTLEMLNVKKGNPKRNVKDSIAGVDYKISANLVVKDNAVLSLFKRHSMSYDATNKYWKMVANDKVDLASRKLMLIYYSDTASGKIGRFREIPMSDLVIQGTETFGTATNTVPIEIMIKNDSDNNAYYDYLLGNFGYLTVLNLKFAVTV